MMSDSGGFRFRVLGFPVHVDWWFLVVAALLGSRMRDPLLILIWVAVVFVSILIHELGHAAVGRMCGMDPAIRLYGGGGLTSFGVGARPSASQGVQISLAGPAAGFATAGLVFFARRALPPGTPYVVWAAAAFLVWVNVVWGLLNLLPMLPLDGGNVMRTIVHVVRGYADERLPRQISIVVGIGAIAAAAYHGMFFAAFIAAWFTFMNFTALQQGGFE